MENYWASTASLHTFTTTSSASRPMAMSAAATGLAATEIAGSVAPWGANATFPSTGSEAALTASAAAIDALVWMAARTDPTKRASTSDALTWLYAVQSMAQAANTPSASASPAPIRRYASPDAAKKVAVTALQDLLPACAQAAAGASTASEVEGVLLAWTKAIRELARLGSPDRSVFPGLRVQS